MLRATILSLTILGLAGINRVEAQNNLPSPVNLPPTVAMAKSVPIKGGFKLRLTVTELRTEESVVAIPKGVYIQVLVTPKEHVIETTINYKHLSALRGTEVFDVHGKRVEVTELLTALEKDTPVLVSCHGMVDPFYLRVAKEDTLVIVLGAYDDEEQKLRDILKHKD